MKKIMLLTALVALISITENINAGSNWGPFLGGVGAGVVGSQIVRSANRSSRRSRRRNDYPTKTVTTTDDDGVKKTVTTYYN